MDKAKSLRSFIQYAEVKSLIDRILLLQETEKFKSVAFLSEYDGEGKTFLIAALALAYSERLNKKVLVIDTSSNNTASTPLPAKDLKENYLLAELLEDTTKVEVMVMRDWAKLRLSPGIDEYQLNALLSENNQNYSMILVDTSSLSRKNKNNFDPLVIARQCDVSVLVSGQPRVREQISTDNRKRIHDAGIRLLGLIYNQGENPHA